MDTQDTFGQPKKSEPETPKAPPQEVVEDESRAMEDPPEFQDLFTTLTDEQVVEKLEQAESSFDYPEERKEIPGDESESLGEFGEISEEDLKIDREPQETKSPAHLTLFPYLQIVAYDNNNELFEFEVHGTELGDAEPPDVPKTAIVNVKLGEEYENIGWFCSEEPQARFFDTIVIPTPRFKRWVKVDIEPEIIESCENLLIVSAMGDRPSACSAWVTKDQKSIIARFKKPLFGRRPKNIIVRIQGKRLGDFPRWKRYTDEERELNNRFWAMAHGKRKE